MEYIITRWSLEADANVLLDLPPALHCFLVDDL